MVFLAPLKKSIMFVVPCIVFGAWLVILAWTSSVSSRGVRFFDVLHQVEILGTYSSEIPAARYVVEPFAGFAFTLGKQLENSLLLFLVGHVVIRFTFALIEKVVYRNSAKKSVIIEHARNVMNFYWKYAFFVLIIAFLVVIIGTVATGFLFLHQYFMSVLQAAFLALLAILMVKVVQNVVIFLTPRGIMRVKPRKPWMSLDRKSPRFWRHKTWDVIGRETRYAISALMIYVMVCMNLISAYFPTQVIHASNMQSGDMLMDFHCHTTLSDGFLTPEERIDWYISQGFNGAAFTDHENVNGALQARAYVERLGLNFTVIIGQEYTKYNPRIHINVFGIEQTIPTDEYLGGATSPSDLPPMNISDMIHYVKSHGGYTIVNHYGYVDEGDYSLERFRDWGITGFEIANGGGSRDDRIRQFCMNNSLVCISASDDDSNQPIPSFTRLRLPDPANKSVHAIFAALRNYSSTECVIIWQNQNHVDWPDALDEFRPAGNFLNYMVNLELGQSISWFVWSGGFFALSIVLVMLARNHIDAAEQLAKRTEDSKKRSFLFAHRGITVGSIIATVVIFILLIQFLLPIISSLE